MNILEGNLANEVVNVAADVLTLQRCRRRYTTFEKKFFRANFMRSGEDASGKGCESPLHKWRHLANVRQIAF